MLTDLWMGLHLVCGVYWFEGQRKRLAQGTTVPGHNHKPPQLSETLIKYNDPGIALTGLKWFAVFPRQKCCPFAKITCCRCHNKRVLSAEGPWLLAVWRARTLRGLELADRIVLYLCSHRLHPGIGHQCGWTGKHGQQSGKEAAVLARPDALLICSLCERKFVSQHITSCSFISICCAPLTHMSALIHADFGLWPKINR